MSVEVVLKFIVVVLILYLGYQLVLKHTPLSKLLGDNDTFVNYVPASAPKYEPAPAFVEPNLPMPEVEGPREIIGGGPSTPSQAAPLDSHRRAEPTEATDPYAEQNEDANAPERLRHPERMFRPAPQMDAIDAIQDSGIGGMAQQTTNNAMQVFAPEFAQNGGEFMSGIFANDHDVPTSFSDF
jgi:hypothetical protein